MAVADLIDGVAELGRPRVAAVALQAALLTLATLVGGFWLLGWGLGVGGGAVSLPLIGALDVSGLGIAAYVAVAAVGSALLAPLTAAVFVGLMLDRVVGAVEARAYPGLPAAPGAPMGRQLSAAARLFVAMVAVNLIGLALFWLAGPLAPALFLLANGWLIGREYVEMVALRRMDRRDARKMRRARRLSSIVIGAAVALLLTIPIVNLVAPIIGAAAATHLTHRAPG